MTKDTATAEAFSESWNRVASGSVYARAQFDDWWLPIGPEVLRDASVLEMGFGNGSLLVHAASYQPRKLVGVELGDTLETTRRNLAHVPDGVVELHRGDLTEVELGLFDVVYCIGVLHHLTEPEQGFQAVLRHTRPGGRFHCWVYAHEGNRVVRRAVDPIRRVSSHLPWWATKYGLALPLSIPFFAYAKSISALQAPAWLPLRDYSEWIATRDFAFFHHVAFDQLVTPTTHYLRRDTIERWLSHPSIEPGSGYIRFRNGNSWTFGGRLKEEVSST